MRFDGTICAPATSAGTGAISVIRLSGEDCLAIVDRVVSFRKGDAASTAGYSIKFGSISDGKETLDDVLVSIFRAPRSYTGEDSAEISCHASRYIVQRILELLTSAGARMAAPGEFTQRAFINGKMDLAQSEAVADLIASQTAAAHRIAINQLKGGFSNELASMREQLLHIVSLMELELDFSEEEVEFADRTELKSLLEKVTEHIAELISSFDLGNAIKNGVPVAIVGVANAGKSTLLNSIVGEDRAIVSEIAGTTRDTIEETYNIDGTLFRFIDTAGLRRSDDTIERIGIERAYEKLSSASLVLAVSDLTSDIDTILAGAKDIQERLSGNQKAVFLLNKADIVPQEKVCRTEDALRSISGGYPCFRISAKEKTGLKDLIRHISETFNSLSESSETNIVANARHLEALKSARSALLRVRESLDTQLPTDLIARDIREALYHLGSIVGEITTDEILGEIFGRFCIGK